MLSCRSPEKRATPTLAEKILDKDKAANYVFLSVLGSMAFLVSTEILVSGEQ